jgi:hypothetical protein
MKTTVIYHSADFDGIFCREIARKFLPDAELVGWNHGDPLIPYPGGTVYILDLSPDCVTEVFSGELNRLIWIDHHKSSIEKWGNDLPGYRVDGVAACRLVWQWFRKESEMAKPENAGKTWPMPTKDEYVNRSLPEPLAVLLAGEYDIWDKRDPDAELFQHGLRSQELTDHIWNQLLDTTIEPTLQIQISQIMVVHLLDGGRILQYARTRENESIIKAAGFTLQFEGLTFLACNNARYNSFLFTAGLKPEHDACFGFAWRDGKWTVSLYHAPGKEHHDLSQIAVKYGGGGHRGACGFQVKTLPFLT